MEALGVIGFAGLIFVACAILAILALFFSILANGYNH